MRETQLVAKGVDADLAVRRHVGVIDSGEETDLGRLERTARQRDSQNGNCSVGRQAHSLVAGEPNVQHKHTALIGGATGSDHDCSPVEQVVALGASRNALDWVVCQVAQLALNSLVCVAHVLVADEICVKVVGEVVGGLLVPLALQR